MAGNSSRPRIVLAGGGSAGHVNPLLATAAHLEAEVAVLGTAEGLEASLVPAAGYELLTLPRVPFPRRLGKDLFTFPSRWKAAARAARAALETPRRADAVVGFGGYVSTPAYLAARKLDIPVVIHEQNARPGLANRLGARFAEVVALTFPSTPLAGKKRTETVGLPLRPQIAGLARARQVDPRAARESGAAALGLDPEKLTVLVTGGSLGAQKLNEVVPRAAAEIIGAGWQILHLTGKGKMIEVPPLAGYHAREYLVEMHHALACTDFVIGRSGAGMVAELSALGIPAIYVPFPIGNGEQRLNAQDVVTAGGGILVEDKNFTPSWLLTHLLPLLTDAAARGEMAARAGRAGIVDAAERLARIVTEVAL